MYSMDLPVTVNQDNSKKLRFNNTNFNHPIELQFDFPDEVCVQPGLADLLSEEQKDALVKELRGGKIQSGGFVIEIDRKKGTGIIVIEYTNSELGLIQVSYSGHIVPPAPVVTEINHDVFEFDGTIFIVWTDKLLACPSPNTVTTVTLNR